MQVLDRMNGVAIIKMRECDLVALEQMLAGCRALMAGAEPGITILTGRPSADKTAIVAPVAAALRGEGKSRKTGKKTGKGKIEARVCENRECGKTYMPVRKDQRYCSKACCQIGSRRTHKKNPAVEAQPSSRLDTIRAAHQRVTALADRAPSRDSLEVGGEG